MKWQDVTVCDDNLMCFRDPRKTQYSTLAVTSLDAPLASPLL